MYVDIQLECDFGEMIQGGVCVSICLEGQFYDPNTQNCVEAPIPQTECPAGEMFDIITQTCMPAPKPECPEGMMWDAATGTCYMEDVTVVCGPGQIMVGGVCEEICLEGQFYDPNTETCMAAPIP